MDNKTNIPVGESKDQSCPKVDKEKLAAAKATKDNQVKTNQIIKKDETTHSGKS